jgi:AcrR family transcriptional regulator
MARKYELKRRAERQRQTRQKIVDAAIQLHRTKGPGRTSLSEVARLAGVQRHTFYSHFPSERDLGLACSGHFYEANPPPDPEEWRAIADPEARLRRGLGDLYGFFERVEDMFSCVLRDAEFHPLTAEVLELRAGPTFAAFHDALAEVVPRSKRARAALALALDFRAWQGLVRRSGLSNRDAVETMVRAILAQ